MYEWIMGFTIALMVLVIGAVGNSAFLPSGKWVLGVTLSKQLKQDVHVKLLLTRGRSIMRWVNVVALVLGLATLLPSYMSIGFVAFSVWMVAYLFAVQAVIEHYWTRLFAYKCQQGWQGVKPEAQTEPQAKRTLRVSKLWPFLPPLVLLLVFLVWHGQQDWVPGAVSLGVVLVLAFLYGVTLLVPRYAAVGDEDQNRQYGDIYEKGWGLCFGLLAYIQAAQGVLLYVLPHAFQRALLAAMMSIVSLLIIVFVHRKVSAVRRSLEEEQPYTEEDGDWFWRAGMYHNPQDARVMVEKRIGIGQTMNMATAIGKGVTYGVLVVTGAVLAYLCVMMLRFDFQPLRIIQSGDSIRVEAPMYQSVFELSEIEAVTWQNELPALRRTNGVADGRCLLGRFRSKDEGMVFVYVYNVQGPFLRVALGDTVIYLGGKTQEETKAYAAMLDVQSKGNTA